VAAKAKAKAKAFTALRAASPFLLLVQEKGTKEKDTPPRTARMKLARCPALLAGLGPAPPSEAKAQRAQPALPRSGRPSEAKAQRAQPALPRNARLSAARDRICHSRLGAT